MFDEYHSDVARIGKSGLDLIAQSPRHYWDRYLNPDKEPEEETPALIFGRLLHVLALEPEVYASKFTIMPDFNKRTNQGKADYQNFVYCNAGKTIITADQLTLATKMIKSIQNHPAASYLLDDKEALKEYRMDFNHLETGTPAKLKMDFFSPTSGWIIDLKSTEDASPEEFGKSVWNYRYDVQAAWYTDGFEAFTGELPRGFAFIAVEKKPPYEVAVYYATPDVLEIGRERYMPNLLVYEQCRQSGEWPGYGDKVQPLNLPGWAFAKMKRK